VQLRTRIVNLVTRRKRAAGFPAQAARRRGSVIVLVAAVLVMVVMIGTAYITSAQFDRQATRELNSNNSQQVANVALDPVLNALEKDFVGEDGEYFNSELDPCQGGIEDGAPSRLLDEPYDYAGQNDLWLASIQPHDDGGVQPHDDGGVPRWRQVSNLLPDRNKPFLTDDDAEDVPIVPADKLSDTNIDQDSRADADGDGLVDSRWARAPVAQIGDLQYAVAYRVVDLSGLANVNIHMGPVNADGNIPADNIDHAPRWRYPSELNFIGWATNSTLLNNVDSTQASNLIAERFSNGAPPMTWDQLRSFWQDGVLTSFDTADYESLGALANELELRRANGLNSPTSATIIDRLMPQFMREDGNASTAETDFRDAGYSGGSILDYFAEEPRHQMTVLGGAIPIRVLKHGGDADDVAARVQADINTAVQTPASMKEDVRRIFEHADGTFEVPDTFSRDANAAYAAQVVACIADYADADNKVTTVGHDGIDYYGLEALPFITEVYRQRNYKLEWEWSSDANEWHAAWKQDGDTGYAVEMRHCFNKAISLENLRLRIGGDSGETIELNQDATELAEDEVLVVYHDPGTGDDQSSMTALVDGGADVEFDGGKVAQFETGTDSEIIEVALMVKDDDDNWVAYQKAAAGKMNDEDMPPEGTNGNSQSNEPGDDQFPDPPGADGVAYKRTSNFGNGNGLNMLTVTGLDFRDETFTKRSHTLGEKPLHDDSGDDEIDKLGVADKNSDGPPDVIDDVDRNQILIADYDDDKLRSVAELAHLVVLGFETDQTIAERWIDSNPSNPPDNVEQFQLPLRSDNIAKSDSDPLALPHAMLLLDRYTVNRYDDDGVDNDLSGTKDEIREAFVPGMLNLNTVSKERLAGLLPLANQNAREDIAELITAYRDRRRPNPSQWTAPNDFNQPNRDLHEDWREGKASIYELYAALWFVLGSDNSDNSELGGVPIDLTHNSDGSVSPDTDDVIDDLEEKALPLRWLSNVTHTRSDVFAVYVTVRGYEVGDWSPAGLKEQIRYVAIVDRSYLMNDNPDQRQVKVLSIMQY
jgi:hypothetical protein